VFPWYSIEEIGRLVKLLSGSNQSKCYYVGFYRCFNCI